MIRLNRFFFIIILFTAESGGYCQDLLNQTNTLRFADYLYKTRQFEYAAQEFERLHFMDQTNEEFKLFLIRSYRLNNNLSLAEAKFNDYFGDSTCVLKNLIFKEFMAIQFVRNDFSSAQKYLNCNKNLDEYSYSYYQACISLLSKNWTNASSLINKSAELKEHFGSVSLDTKNIRYKNPFLAASMSAILPGSGKMYSGYWKDGIIAFVFVAANLFQTYRGFTVYGADHAHGWIFGGLTIGFYAGNIFGSARSAIKYNRKVDDKLYSHAKEIIFSDLE